jgi:hypothetical protein
MIINIFKNIIIVYLFEEELLNYRNERKEDKNTQDKPFVLKDGFADKFPE